MSVCLTALLPFLFQFTACYRKLLLLYILYICIRLVRELTLLSESNQLSIFFFM